MTSVAENNEDDSFIILGSSPGTSLDAKCNGFATEGALDKAQLVDAMKDMSKEASMAFKAHFKLGDCPSPASIMVASTMVSEDQSTEEIQKRFGEILDENLVLKETLKQNNDSMKDQFLLIAACQEDMMRTHKVHKQKFDETRQLVEKLRQENNKLKQDIIRLADSGVQTSSVREDIETNGDTHTGPSSAVEFVSSPDDDTINKLTTQLELVEKQRRQVIIDNEKLTWQKESLEHIVDATSKERDELKEKVKNLELQLSVKASDNARIFNDLQNTIQELNKKLMTSSTVSSVSPEEIRKRDAVIQQLETKVTSLQHELQSAQLKILDLESVKLEFTKHKSGVSDTVKLYKEQIKDLQSRIKEVQTTVFQPVRLSLSAESQSTQSEYSSFINNVKLYDKTLKHMSELLNSHVHGSSDNIVQTLGLISSLLDYKLERASADTVRSNLTEVKKSLEKQHSASLQNMGQVKNMLSIFEGIFKEYNEILKKTVAKQEKPAPNNSAVNVEALTTALVARGQEITELQAELKKLRAERDDIELLRAQLEIYKSDFEAERESREKMAADKENILTDLRNTQKLNDKLNKQLEEVRKLSPEIHQSVTKKPVPSTASSPASRPSSATSTATTGNMVYKCPKCMRFSSDQYELMEDHFDFCFDDL